MITTFENDEGYLVQCNTGDIEQTNKTDKELENYISEKFTLHSSSECFSCHTTMQVSINQFTGYCAECNYNFVETHCLHQWCPQYSNCVTVIRK